MTTESDSEYTPDATEAFGPAVEDSVEDYLDGMDEEHEAPDPVTGESPSGTHGEN